MLRHRHILLIFLIFQGILLVSSAEKKAEPANDDDSDADVKEDADDAKKADPDTSTSTTVSKTSTTIPEVADQKDGPGAPPDSFYVSGSDNQICIAANLEPEFSFTTLKQELGTPYEPHFGGHCGSATQPPILYIDWNHCNMSLTFNISKDGTEWSLSRMEFQYNPVELFKLEDEESRTVTVHVKDEDLAKITAPIGQSIKCDPATIDLYDDNDDVQVVVVFPVFQVQAINVSNEFGPEKSCAIPKAEPVIEKPPKRSFRSDVAPIAVGSTLAVLTLAVLAGYAIYRSLTTKKVDYSTME